jgi:hypothetical protein
MLHVSSLLICGQSATQRKVKMNEAWKLGEGETIDGCTVPTDDPWQMPVCTECGKVAYRVVVIGRPGNDTRCVPLCGGHFTSACLQIPALNKYNRGGKIG